MHRIRTWLPLALLLLAACANQRTARLSQLLDAYSLPKPLPEAWPQAIRLANEEGFRPVGKDRELIGEEAQGAFGQIFARGYETRLVGKGRWESQTNPNPQLLRYRVKGFETDEKSCRIEYWGIQGNDQTTNENEFRDVEMELKLVERIDAASADRMAAEANKG